MTLAVLMNLGFAGGEAGADPPTTLPITVNVTLARAKNRADLQESANLAAAAETQNSVNVS